MRPLFLAAASWVAICACALPAAGVPHEEDEGDAAFARGDYTAAAAHYSAAVAESPAALRTPRFKANWVRAKSGACCEAAERLMAGGNGLAALAQVREAAALDPSWDRPLQLLARAAAAAADDCFSRACKMADRGSMEDVRRQLEESLKWAPGHAKARTALAFFSQKPHEKSDWEAAQHAVSGKQWDVAEQAWHRVLAGNALHLPARIGLAQARESMAGARLAIAQARVALQAGHVGEAHALHAKAVAEWPGVPFGLALGDELAMRRQAAAKAVDQGLAATRNAEWGGAISAYREALRQDPMQASAKAGLEDAIIRHAEDLGAHGRPGAALMVCRGGRGMSARIRQKEEALLRDLRRGSEPRLAWVVEGERVPAAELSGALSSVRTGAGDPWEIKVKINALEAGRRRTRSDAGTWAWETVRAEPNPAYDTARLKLDYAIARQRQAQWGCDAARAATGGHALNCRCAECARWRSCNAQVAQWRDAAADLAMDLNHTPREREVPEKHEAAYTDEWWQASGRLAVEFILPQGDPESKAVAYEKSAVLRLGARPEVGLEAKVLDLPVDDAAIRQDMMKRLAQECIPLLCNRAVVSKAVLLKRAANAALQSGDQDGALELRVKAAALLGVIAPELSEKELKALE